MPAPQGRPTRPVAVHRPAQRGAIAHLLARFENRCRRNSWRAFARGRRSDIAAAARLVIRRARKRSCRIVRTRARASVEAAVSALEIGRPAAAAMRRLTPAAAACGSASSGRVRRSACVTAVISLCASASACAVGDRDQPRARAAASAARVSAASSRGWVAAFARIRNCDEELDVDQAARRELQIEGAPCRPSPWRSARACRGSRARAWRGSRGRAQRLARPRSSISRASVASPATTRARVSAMCSQVSASSR